MSTTLEEVVESSAHTAPVSLAGLRIAYLVNQYPQPSHTFIRREIEALEQLGAEVTRFTLRRGSAKLVDTADQAEQNRTHVVLSAGMLVLCGYALIEWLRAPLRTTRVAAFALLAGLRSDRGVIAHWAYFLEACALKRWLLADGLTHVHAHFGTNATMVAMLCHRLGGPGYSFTVHGPEEFDKPEFLHLPQKLRECRFAVAVSEFGRSQLLRLLSWQDWHKVRIIRCGLSESFFDQRPAPIPAEPRLVCVARLHEQKGLPVLVEAAALLKQRRVACEIVIIGDGPLRSALQAQITARKLDNTVQLWGLRNGAEIEAALRSARAFVLPSFAEGLPVAIMEALALHRPVISTYVAGIPELVEPGKCGWLVAAGSAEQLADAIEQALQTDDATLATMGAEGARRVGERHRALSEATRLGELIGKEIT